VNRSELANQLLKTPSFNGKSKPPRVIVLDSHGGLHELHAATYDETADHGDGAIVLNCEPYQE
jgi:hypothetical protein